MEWENAVLAFSSVLSMIGSILVAFTWAYPKDNRKKHGRILLFWLSVTDFMSSLFYFISAFGPETGRTCEALALLDIFFPVASFIWTDFIAYYLYMIVRSRGARAQYNWRRLLILFHITAWGISFIVTLIVGVTGHAGMGASDDDSDDSVNTGGWCWIKYTGHEDTFIWELIGGKLIEWASVLVIVPLLYISVACELYQIEKKNYGGTLEYRESITGIGMKKATSKLSLISDSDAVRNVFHSKQNPRVIREISEDVSIEEGKDGVEGNGHGNRIFSDESDAERLSGQLFQSGKLDNYDSSRSSFVSGNVEEHPARTILPAISSTDNNSKNGITKGTIDPINLHQASDDTSAQPKRTHSTGTTIYFTKFYLKLALLPLVFIFVRFWGSLHILLVYAKSPAAENSVIIGLQTFFDPSQGFFNAILFVLFSRSDRQEVYQNLCSFCSFCCPLWSKKFIKKPSKSSDSVIPRFQEDGVTTTNQLRDQLIHNSKDSEKKGAAPMLNVVTTNQENSPTGPGTRRSRMSRDADGDEFIVLVDLDADFECDDENRLSNFSFDSRIPSNSFSEAPPFQVPPSTQK
jgi:hypothetical protein